MINKRDSFAGLSPTLTPLCGGTDKKPRFLDKDVVAVGRARGCDIAVDANEISAVHCIFYRAAVGYRVRDCGSRTGTRVNGTAVRNAVLTDGDIVQIGPFSFELKLPAELAAPPAIDPEHLERVNRSRRNLARLALELRRKARHGGANLTVLNDKSADLKAKIRGYDQKVHQLEAAELELSAEREKLEQDKEEHREHVQQVESDLARRLQDAERDIRAQWTEFQRRCSAEDIRLESSAVKNAPPAAKEAGQAVDDNAAAHTARQLEEREARIEQREAAAVIKQRQLGQEQERIERERQEVGKLKASWEAEQKQACDAAEQQLLAVERAETRMQRELSEEQERLEREKDEVTKLRASLEAEQKQARLMVDEQRQAAEHAEAGLQRELTEEQERLERERDEIGQLKASLEAALEQARRAKDVQIQTVEHADAAPQRDLTDEEERLQREREEIAQLKSNLADELEQARLAAEVQRVAAEQSEIRHQRELDDEQARIEQQRVELTKLKASVEAENRKARTALDQQRIAVAQAETHLREQKAGLTRMVADIKQVQEDLRKQPRVDPKPLQQEIQQLRQLVAEHEVRLAGVGPAGPSAEEFAQLAAENDRLRQQLSEKDESLEEMRIASPPTELMPAVQEDPRVVIYEFEIERLRDEVTHLSQQLDVARREQHVDTRIDPAKTAEIVPGPREDLRVAILEHEAERLRGEVAHLAKQLDQARADAEQTLGGGVMSENELENYEGELNRFRQQLESDRAKLGKEIDSLRARNQELDDATREMEMEMSRERAEMARERMRLDRMREDIKAEMDRIQRDGGVRESLASVQRLRDEIKTAGRR